MILLADLCALLASLAAVGVLLCWPWRTQPRALSLGGRLLLGSAGVLIATLVAATVVGWLPGWVWPLGQTLLMNGMIIVHCRRAWVAMPQPNHDAAANGAGR